MNNFAKYLFNFSHMVHCFFLRDI